MKGLRPYKMISEKPHLYLAQNRSLKLYEFQAIPLKLETLNLNPRSGFKFKVSLKGFGEDDRL